MVNWLQIRRDPIEAVEHGVAVAADGDLFNSCRLAYSVFMSWICKLFGHKWLLAGGLNTDESVQSQWSCQRCGERYHVDGIKPEMAQIGYMRDPKGAYIAVNAEDGIHVSRGKRIAYDESGNRIDP